MSLMEGSMNFLSPARCDTCSHHKLGQYDPEEDYQEHWCEIEENAAEGCVSGMHLENCLFAAIGVPLCKCYDRIENLQDEHFQQQECSPEAETAYKKLKVLIPKEKIFFEVRRLAQEINNDYKGKNPLIIGILKGSFVFLADLIRFLDIPVEIDFVRFSSYGSAKVSSGKVKMVHSLQTSVEGRNVIVVDDVIDTGLSISHFVKYVKKRKPASVKTCALLDKPSRRKVAIAPDYVGITIPDKFVVGYGIDCNEAYRHLADICITEE
jgi:hypoxanthine phosphoribosyltransferase